MRSLRVDQDSPEVWKVGNRYLSVLTNPLSSIGSMVDSRHQSSFQHTFSIFILKIPSSLFMRCFEVAARFYFTLYLQTLTITHYYYYFLHLHTSDLLFTWTVH